MNAGPFGDSDERGSVPEARRAPGKRDESNIPDWAKITANIDDLPSDDTGSFDLVEDSETSTPPAPPASPFGGADANDDWESAPEPAAETQVAPQPVAPAPSVPQPVAPQPEPANNADEVKPRPSKTGAGKPKRYVPMKKAITKLPEHKYAAPPEETSPSKGKKFNGGRWKVLALRAGVWSSFGMILLVGIFTIIGPKGPSISAVTNNVLSQINRNAFPLEEGEQIASRFIERYMTYDPALVAERSVELSQYIVSSASGASASITLFDGSRPQVVVDGPYLAGPVELVSDNHVVYTFAIEVENPSFILTDPNNSSNISVLEPIPARWVYVAVPMVADAEGHIAVAGAPAVVPQPPKADGVDEIRIKVDRDASLEAKDSMTEFFKLWGESYQEGLRPYLVVGESTQAAQIGLQNAAAFVALNALDVEELPEDYEPDPEVPPTCVGPDYEAPCRNALATVTWAFPDGTQFSQNYRLIVFNDGQNWRVIDIRGGKFDSIGR